MTMRPMILADTVQDMTSTDYKERFRAEYNQLSIRLGSLTHMLERYAEGTLDFVPTCPIYMLEEQAAHMNAYLYLLRERAKIEGIEL